MKEWPQVLYERFISKPCLWLCKSLRITPNMITIFNFLITITFGVWCFATRHYFIALGIMLLNGLLDYIDGDLARATNQKSEVGGWLDTGGDVILQNSIMAGIAYGLVKTGFNISIVLLFFVGNSAMNLISFYYNSKFHFTSHAGSEKFRNLMDKGFFTTLIDPTASPIGLIAWTVRYWIVLGIFWRMDIAFYSITILTTFRWIAMYVIYSMYLAGNRSIYLLMVLEKCE